MEAVIEQETFQDNVCEGAFAECINSGIDLIDIFASDQATIEIDSQQQLEQGNECKDMADCENSGVQALSTFASDQASINSKDDQSIEIGNECQGETSCENSGVQGLSTFASDQASVEIDGDQKLIEQNSCEGVATLCQNSGLNALQIEAAGPSTDVNSVSEQTIDTKNDCKAGAQCTTDLQNSASIVAQDRDVTSNIKQTIEVNNSCEGAVTCTVGSTNTPDTPVDNNEEEPSGEASISAAKYF